MLSVGSRKIANKLKSVAVAGQRTFAVTIPHKKLHFIDHEVHGKVYPVACYNKAAVQPRKKISLMLGSSAITTSVLYSLFIDPILQYTSLAVL